MAVVAAVILIIAIAVVLIVPAILVGLAVLMVAAAATRLRGLVGGLLPRADGRRNVRVIMRRDSLP